MKRHFLSLIATAILAGAAQAQVPPAQPDAAAAPKTDFSKIFGSEKEKNSYAVGLNYGAGLTNQMIRSGMTADEFDMDALDRGFKAGLGSAPAVITDAQKGEILSEFQKVVRDRVLEKQKAQASAGAAFLAKNKEQPGVITTASGLQYKVISEGSGAAPGPNDQVSVNYRGTMVDGTEFDNSAKTGRPFTTKVAGGVIPGWTEVLQLMKPGAKYQVFIPANLAYGANGMAPGIPPNSVLIFDMELVSVQPAAAMPAAAPPTSSVAAPVSGAVLTSDVIKVPSKEEMDKGAKIETIKAEDLEKERLKAAAAGK